MIRIAINMLISDRVKYTILICALAFSTLLITQQMGVFLGLMGRTVSFIRNINAPIWVTRSDVAQVEFPFEFKETYLDTIRSLPDVQAAWPLLARMANVKVIGGSTLNSQIIGLEASTLTGVPGRVIKGSINNIWNDGTVAIDQFGIELLSKGRDKPLDVGDLLYINDHEAKIAAIVEIYASFSSFPHIYTTYPRAIEMLPPSRNNTSFIIVEPKKGVDPEVVIKEIESNTDLKAYTAEQLRWKTIWWVTENTGVVLSFSTTVLLGFIVGVVIAGQTFYSFIYENSGNWAALKAIGLGNNLIRKMIVAQVFVAGFIGYGIGLLCTAAFGFFTFYSTTIPFYINNTILLLTFFLIILICVFSAYLGLRRINRLSPAEVFRGGS